MSVLEGYPRKGIEVYRCRDCGGEADGYARFATFPAREHADVVRSAKHLPMRVSITAPKNKDGIVKVDFFPRAPRTCGSVTICSRCGTRSHAGLAPCELYYQTAIRGVRLWAHNREHLVQLREYIARRGNRGQGFHKLPATILKATNRALVLKKIDLLLASA